MKTAAKKDGTITAWQSETWSTGGLGGGNLNAQLFPYVFTKVPNRRINHTAVSVNAGGARAWRAPSHPQVCYITCSALEDLAAKIQMDPLDMFLKNLNYTSRAELYKFQFAKAAELMEWKKNWHPRGDSGSGHIKRGLGLALGTWGGAGHASTCKTTIHPDASVEVELATQDLGTGTRTMVAMIAAETFGLPVSAIKVKLGDNSYPNSGGSGGSTTVGGVTSSSRKSSVNALAKLFEVVAKSLNVSPDDLEAVDQRIRVKGNPDKAMSFQQACQKLGVNSISEMGENNPRTAPQEGLNTGGVGGVQMADVSVDIETGIVKMNRLVAVQDCGLVVNPKTAESQVYGACIMSICGALFEERIMDEQTGRVLNPDMEFYKLAGIGDIGEIIVHMDIREENDKRGVVGLGEPCAIGGIAAIGNAVANAIGVRATACAVDTGAGVERARKEDRVMQAFEYANPSTLHEALGLLGSKWGEADVSGGRHRPDQPDEGVHPHAQARGEHQGHQGTWRHPSFGAGIADRRDGDVRRTGVERGGARRISIPAQRHHGSVQPADPQHGDRGRRPLSAPALLVLSPRFRVAGHEGWQEPGARTAIIATTRFSAADRRIS